MSESEFPAWFGAVVASFAALFLLLMLGAPVKDWFDLDGREWLSRVRRRLFPWVGLREELDELKRVVGERSSKDLIGFANRAMEAMWWGPSLVASPKETVHERLSELESDHSLLCKYLGVAKVSTESVTKYAKRRARK